MNHQVEVSDDGHRIVSGSYDFTVRIWNISAVDARAWREMRTLEGHTSDVYAVAISGDGLRVASGSGDLTVRVWVRAQECNEIMF